MSAVTCRRAASSFDFVCFFFQKIILFYLHTCPAPQKSSVLLQSFVCLFFSKEIWNAETETNKFTYDFGNYFLSLKHFEHFFFFELFLPPIILFPLWSKSRAWTLMCVLIWEKKEQSKEMCELKAQNATLWLSLISVCNISSSIFCFVGCASKNNGSCILIIIIKNNINKPTKNWDSPPTCYFDVSPIGTEMSPLWNIVTR